MLMLHGDSACLPSVDSQVLGIVIGTVLVLVNISMVGLGEASTIAFAKNYFSTFKNKHS